MGQLEISFITPLFNCLQYTKDYLRSLRETVSDYSYEVILIDDLSTDGTREFLGGLSTPPYRVFLNETNLGFAKSSNFGARQARGQLLCFLNNDIVLNPNWLQPMAELIANCPDVGAVGNVQIEPDTGRVHHAGVFFDWEGRPLHAWRHRRSRPRGDYGEWNAITAACFLARAEIFRKFDGFDEVYRNGFEDIDLCVRMKQKGCRLLVSNRSIIGHYASVSPGRKKFDKENLERFLVNWQDTTKVWGKKEWPGHFVQRHARAWWKMLSWRRAHAYCILIWRGIRRESQ